jgi:transcriptional regulator with XRE-family HTH domain
VPEGVVESDRGVVDVSQTWQERQRAEARRPITDDEVPYLEAMGTALRRLRSEARLSRRILGLRAQVHQSTLTGIEHGSRRTRRSTLERIAAALVEELPARGTAAELVDYLVELAGPALAPVSAYDERVQRRRARRLRRRQEEFEARCEIEFEVEVRADEMAAQWVPSLTEEILKQKRRAIREYAAEVRTREMARVEAHRARLEEKADTLAKRQAELKRRERELERREAELARPGPSISDAVPDAPADKPCPDAARGSSVGPIMRCAILGCDTLTSPGEALCRHCGGR